MELLGLIGFGSVAIGIFGYLAKYAIEELIYLNELEEQES